MRIIEVISEAIGTTPPVGTTTVTGATNGVPKVGTPASQPVPGQQQPQGTQTPPVTGVQQQPAGGAQQLGATPATGTPQPMGQDPALQQGMQSTMTDLNTIAQQINLLKQKQQQMQQQVQKSTL